MEECHKIYLLKQKRCENVKYVEKEDRGHTRNLGSIFHDCMTFAFGVDLTTNDAHLSNPENTLKAVRVNVWVIESKTFC